MQKRRRRRNEMSLSKVYSDSFRSFLSNESLLIFLIGIIIFLILYLPIQGSVGLAGLYGPRLSNITAAASLNSPLSSSLLISKLSGSAGVPGFMTALFNIMPSLISSSLSFILLFFAIAVLEVLIVRRVVSNRIELPIRSYMNLLALLVIVTLFIEMPLFLMLFFGLSLTASVNAALGVLIFIIAALLLIYVAVKLIFAQIYAIAKKVDPISSIELSFKVTDKKFWFVFGTLFIPLILITFVVSIIFGTISSVLPSASALINAISLSFLMVLVTTILTKYLLNYLEQ